MNAAASRRLEKIRAFAEAHRPTCAMCGRPVDRLYIQTSARPHTIICTAICHGAQHSVSVTIPDPENVVAFTPTLAFTADA